MSPVPAPRRGIQRASHLRQVSNGSSDTFGSRPATEASDTGTIQNDPVPPSLPTERKCILWVHDEGFSKEEVVLNLDLFPDVKAGDLMAILALKTDTGVRDFQDKAQPLKKDVEALSATMERERSGSHPRSPGFVNGSYAKILDVGNRCLFIAKDMPKEIKAKQPTLEVSVAKHIADVFCLKHRSNILLTTVRQRNNSLMNTMLIKFLG
jgi:hypothetical protein